MWDLPPPVPAVELVVASRGMSKGVAQTEGAQFVPKAYLQLGRVQVGAQWKNVDSPVADGEGAAFVNLTHKLGDYQLGVGASLKFQTNVTEPTDDKSFEFTTSVARTWKKLSLKVAATYSPDDLGSAERSLYIEGGPAFELDGTTRLSANLGVRRRKLGPNYTSFNAGISKTLFKKLTIDLRAYDTSRDELGEFYHRRAVISGRLTL